MSFSSDEEVCLSLSSLNVNLKGSRYNPEGRIQLLAQAPKGINSSFKNECGFVLR